MCHTWRLSCLRQGKTVPSPGAAGWMEKITEPFNIFQMNDKSEPISYRNQVRIISFWWALRDSNPGPSGYEPDALAN